MTIRCAKSISLPIPISEMWLQLNLYTSLHSNNPNKWRIRLNATFLLLSLTNKDLIIPPPSHGEFVGTNFSTLTWSEYFYLKLFSFCRQKSNKISIEGSPKIRDNHPNRGKGVNFFISFPRKLAPKNRDELVELQACYTQLPNTMSPWEHKSLERSRTRIAFNENIDHMVSVLFCFFFLWEKKLWSLWFTLTRPAE